MRGAVWGLVVVGACSFDSAMPEPGTADGPPGQPTADAAHTMPVDAMLPIDAAPTVSCPGSYDISHGSSRYRIAGKDNWLNAEATCESDTSNWSHLVAFDDDGEWSSLTLIAALTHPNEWFYIGVVRDMDSPAGPWRTVTGGNAPVIHWQQTLTGNEPNNTGGTEAVVVIDTRLDVLHAPTIGGYLDVSPSASFYFICECDGHQAMDARYDN